MRTRDRRILQIIGRRPITTQEDLVRSLRAAGIDVTQATVSRDIKRLGLVKVPDAAGSYRYQAPAAARRPTEEVQALLHKAVQDYVTEIDQGGGVVVVKTTTGSAGVVAEAIDEVAWPEVVGTVAGDNTIIVIPRRPAHRAVILKRLRAMT